MKSINYKQLLVDTYRNQELSPEDFEDTLMHFAKLYHQEKSVNQMFQIFKYSLPEIDGNKTTSWRYKQGANDLIFISCSNKTRDHIPPPDVVIPPGYELVNKSCIEDDERWTRWEWVIGKSK